MSNGGVTFFWEKRSRPPRVSHLKEIRYLSTAYIQFCILLEVEINRRFKSRLALPCIYRPFLQAQCFSGIHSCVPSHLSVRSTQYLKYRWGDNQNGYVITTWNLTSLITTMSEDLILEEIRTSHAADNL